MSSGSKVDSVDDGDSLGTRLAVMLDNLASFKRDKEIDDLDLCMLPIRGP